MRKILLSTVAIAAMTGTAFAADLPSTKSAPVYVAPVSAYNWTGFYAGVEGGYDFYSANYVGAGHNNANAGLLGGLVGYNYQVNQFVLGLEGDAGGLLGANHTLISPGNGSIRTNGSYFGDIRGRVGYAIDRALLYVAGGAAFGDVNSKFYDTNGAWLGTTNARRVGWTIGGGGDYAFTPNWIGRIEYRYANLGTYTDNVVYGGSVRNNSNAVLVGLMYKFGAPEAISAKY